ncbi:hypothetical protein U0070_018715, partial [Myodes glareolus]
MVGHVDFKFVLNSNITSVPQIQVTLLKNKAPGLGKANAVNERGADEMCSGGMRPVVRLPSLKHQGHQGYSLASLLAKVAAGKEKSSNVKNENAGSTRKSENLRGCDLLQEVFVTIRRFKKTSISEESNGKCDPCQPGFGSVLLKALLDNMCFLPAAATGGSVYWYFVLLNYVKDEDLAGCSTACAALLTAVSRQLQDRLTPLEALLQTRYGLYSFPFDPVLFDLEMSGSSCKNVYNSSIGVQSDEIDLSDVLSGNGKVSSCTAAEGSFTSLTGLLEVEPLHFTCVSTSDGTRLERDDASTFTGIYL